MASKLPASGMPSDPGPPIEIPTGDLTSPPAEQVEVISAEVRTVSAFHGPIPPPALLREYGLIEPTIASRIVKMAEDGLAHEHRMRESSLNAQIADAAAQRQIMSNGQWCGLIVALVGIVSSAAVIMSSPTTGGVIGGTLLGGGTLGSIVYAFITGRKPPPEPDKPKQEDKAETKPPDPTPPASPTQ